MNPAPRFDTAFPNDASRCANCGAPALRHEMVIPPQPGFWTQRFDGERFLRERIEALSAEELFAIARGAQQSGFPMMQWPSALRDALLETLVLRKDT